MGIFSKNQDSNEDNSRVQFSSADENNPGATATIRRVFSLEDQNNQELYQQEQQQGESHELMQPSDNISPNNANTSGYGIDNAIELMRQMPDGDIGVIITVVKKTLESTNVQVTDIITDAKNKEADIRSRTKRLEAEIRDLEEKISTRSTEIGNLQTSLDETVQVREYLQISEPEGNAPHNSQSQSFDMSPSKPKHIEKTAQQAQIEEQVAREVNDLALEPDSPE